MTKRLKMSNEFKLTNKNLFLIKDINIKEI